MKKLKAQKSKTVVTSGEECRDIYLLGSRKDVNRLYQAMDAFILPSRYEGLPVVAVEAQAAGLPCILSARITNEVKITRDVTFLDIEAGSIQWAEAVLQRGNTQRIKQNMIDEFDIKCQANRLRDYYSGLIEAIGQ